MLESAVQQRVQLEMARLGGLVWRNNVGVAQTEHGRPVRYGLCNESAQMNRRLKSSDLIGITPIVIQQHHMGQTMGVFTALECKASDWHMVPSDHRAQAQQRFIDLVRGVGGRGGIITDPAQVQGLVL